MTTAAVIGAVALLEAFAIILYAMRRYRRVKAGFNIGRSGFYIEAENDARDN